MVKADKPRENRVPIMMSDDELAAIDDWRFANRISTRSDAIRRLAQFALVADALVNPLTKVLIKNFELMSAVQDQIGKISPDESIKQLDAALHRVTFDSMMEGCKILPNWVILRGQMPAENAVDYANKFGSIALDLDTSNLKAVQAFANLMTKLMGGGQKSENE